MDKLTKESLETKDVAKLSDILEELCDINNYSEVQKDELFEDIICRDDNFILDKNDIIYWILRLQINEVD